MNNTTRFLIILFAVMFFWALNVPAFASLTQCFDDGRGIIRCVKPDGTITTIVKG